MRTRRARLSNMTWEGAESGLARRRRSLRVVLGALMALVILVAVLGTWQVLAARSSQRSQILDGELSEARLASNTVQSAVSSWVQVLDNLANQPGSASLFNDGAPTVQLVLAELRRLYPEFSNLAMTNNSAAVVAQDPQWPATDALSSARRAAVAGALRTRHGYVTGAFYEPSASPPGVLAITIGVPVHDSTGMVAGIVQATVPVSALSAAVGGTSLSGGGRLVLIDESGHVMTGPASSANESHRSDPLISQALDGRSGTGSGSLPGFSGSRLVAYSPVRSLGWAVVVENSQSALRGPVAALTERLVAIGAAVVLFAVATALVLWMLLRQLGRQRDEVTAIIAGVGEGVATVDLTGRVLRVNPALEKLCGRRRQDLQGRPWAEAFVVYDERGAALSWEDTVVSRAIESRQVVASRGYSLSLSSADGRLVPVAMTASPLFIDLSVPSGAVVVVRDVSREREVDQLKSSLVSTVSHELRTPLTLIHGFTELLLTKDNLDARQARAALSQVHESSKRLARLIDDLLSVSRIESGRLTVEVAPLDLSRAVEDVISNFAIDNGHRLTTDIPPDLAPLIADRDKTVQVLTNLISNAIKYSPAGTEVHVSARSAGNHAEIKVSDQGIGMTSEEAASVFEKFSRSSRPEVRKVGGTGLGLYITKNLVEMQGGQVWIQSEQGSGSTFTFTLPFERVLAHRGANEEVACEPS